jgi:hypothetical protein
MSSKDLKIRFDSQLCRNELPVIFLAVEFGRAWRELQERDVAWNLEGLGTCQPA